jgi:TPR repeat protein
MGSEQLLDHSHLKPGGNASLLSYATTINMYRTNAKKTNDVEIQCDFAIFLVEAAKRLLNDVDETTTAAPATTTSGDDNDQPHSEDNSNNDDDATTTTDRHDGGGENRYSASAYLTEAEKLLKQVASHGHSPSQYYLANMYSSGLLHKSNKFEYDKAFPLYVQSAKHHHPDAAYR